MTNGSGPVEKKISAQRRRLAPRTVHPITLNGVTYAKGLGAHGLSEVRYALDGACSVLTAVVGVDDEVGNRGSVAFQVWTDGLKRYDSGAMDGAMASANVNVDLAGAAEMALILTDGGDGSDGDHGSWADARITCAVVDDYLSDRAWSSMTNALGPIERPNNKGLGGTDGKTITLNGATTRRASARKRAPTWCVLDGACDSFTAIVGVDDEVGAWGSAVFQVWTDGVKKCDSGVMNGAMAERASTWM